jgi:hypothetical protein
VALFLVLGGGAYAVSRLPANSVGSRQLKAHAVTLSKVEKKTATLFRATHVTARTDSTGIPMSCSYSSPFWSCSAPQATAVAHCRPHEKATGGSYVVGQPWGTQGGTTVYDTGPSPATGTPTGWFVTASFVSPYASTSATRLPIVIHVVCAT